jgi:hypothetical protein
MSNGTLKSLSDAVFAPVNTAYQAGGFALAFLSLGSFEMLVAFFLPGNETVRYVLVLTGFGLVAMVGTLFYSKQLSPLLKLRKSIRENKELIDTIQETAIELTKLTSDLQAFALVHAHEVAGALQTIQPLLRNVPFLKNLADNKVISRAETLSSTIIEYSERSETIVSDLRTAIIESNPLLLQGYLSELKQLRTKVRASLKSKNSTESATTPLAQGAAE